MAKDDKKEDLKKTITDLFSFDMEKDFYKDDKKSELVDMFRKVIEADDLLVRKFLDKFFTTSLDLAKEFGLTHDEKEDYKEEKPETEEETPEEEAAPEEAGAETEEKPKEEAGAKTVTPESVYIRRANNYLI